jgi:hypothetical protein
MVAQALTERFACAGFAGFLCVLLNFAPRWVGRGVAIRWREPGEQTVSLFGAAKIGAGSNRVGAAKTTYGIAGQRAVCV